MRWDLRRSLWEPISIRDGLVGPFVHAARAAGRERVAVGFYGSAAAELLPRVLAVFSERHPSVDVAVRELSARPCRALLMRGPAGT
jgi:DNA-binding transcriptional LysR family regulator